MAQYKVNEASQEEITMLNEKIKGQEKEFQSKLQEYVQFLDIRNERIQVKYDYMIFFDFLNNKMSFYAWALVRKCRVYPLPLFKFGF